MIKIEKEVIIECFESGMQGYDSEFKPIDQLPPDYGEAIKTDPKEMGYETWKCSTGKHRIFIGSRNKNLYFER
ncbi:MAG: hypothetical protein IIA82_00930 [Thaumarchaeota archaeon]|nr:hypothetical protein [Nitrososphaerota archaeon]